MYRRPSWGSLSASSMVRCCGTTLCFQLQPDKSGQNMVSHSLFFQRIISASSSSVKLLLLSIMELQIQPKHITPPQTWLLPLLLGLFSSAANEVPPLCLRLVMKLPDLIETYRLWKPFHTPFIFILYKDYFSKPFQVVGCKKPLMITIFSLFTSVSVLKMWASLMFSTRKYKL